MPQQVSQRSVHTKIVPLQPVAQGCSYKLLVDLILMQRNNGRKGHKIRPTGCLPDATKAPSKNKSMQTPSNDSLLFDLHSASKLGIAAFGHGSRDRAGGNSYPQTPHMGRTAAGTCKCVCVCVSAEQTKQCSEGFWTAAGSPLPSAAFVMSTCNGLLPLWHSAVLKTGDVPAHRRALELGCWPLLQPDLCPSAGFLCTGLSVVQPVHKRLTHSPCLCWPGSHPPYIQTHETCFDLLGDAQLLVEKRDLVLASLPSSPTTAFPVIGMMGMRLHLRIEGDFEGLLSVGQPTKHSALKQLHARTCNGSMLTI